MYGYPVAMYIGVAAMPGVTDITAYLLRDGLYLYPGTGKTHQMAMLGATAIGCGVAVRQY